MDKKHKRISYVLNTAVMALLWAALVMMTGSGVINRGTNGILILVCINVILALSLNLTTGFLGQLTLGHAGFMAIGAYTSAIFTKASGIESGILNLLIAIAIGGVCAAAAGVLIGVPALRLKGDYLAIITLGFGEIIRVIIEALDITGGAQGLRSIPKITKLPTAFIVAVCTAALLFAFIRTRHGRAIIAIREDEIAAESMGINITFYKTMAFTTAAFLAGVAGVLFSHYLGILGADNFDFNRSIEIVVMVVLGGLGSFTGSIISAVGLTLLPFLLRDFAEYRMLIYSVALIAVMIFRPKGLMGRHEFSLMKTLEKFTDRFKKAGSEPARKGGE